MSNSSASLRTRGEGDLPQILFVTYGGGHVRMVLAVANWLRDSGLADPVILGLTTARAQVLSAGFNCFGFRDFVEQGDESAVKRGFELAAELGTHPGVDLNESASYLGLCYADLVEKNGVVEAERLYRAYGRQVFLPVIRLGKIISRVKPAAVVATSAPRAERAAILAAVQQAIPSLCMVDMFAAYEIEWLKEEKFASRLCVLNEQVKSRLVAAGRRKEDIAATGNPAFDNVNLPITRSKGLGIRKGLDWGNDCVLLWVSQLEPRSHPSEPGEGDPGLPGRVLDVLRSMVGTMTGVRLVMRPHPSENARMPALAANEYWSTADENIHDILQACDIVVVLTSTVGVEAAMAGKYVIQVLGSLYSHAAPYLEMDIADDAVELNGLPAAVQVACNHVRQQPPAPAFSANGGATGRVVQQLMDLLQ